MFHILKEAIASFASSWIHPSTEYVLLGSHLYQNGARTISPGC